MSGTYIYAIFTPDGRWGLGYNRRALTAQAKRLGGYVMRHPSGTRTTWDGPTFRACAELVADFTTKEQAS